MNHDQFAHACVATAACILAATPARNQEDATDPGHLRWMLEQAIAFYGAVRIEKANRWLGFVQGVAVARGWASLDEMKSANAPEGATFDRGRL